MRLSKGFDLLTLFLIVFLVSTPFVMYLLKYNHEHLGYTNEYLKKLNELRVLDQKIKSVYLQNSDNNELIHLEKSFIELHKSLNDKIDIYFIDVYLKEELRFIQEKFSKKISYIKELYKVQDESHTLINSINYYIEFIKKDPSLKREDLLFINELYYKTLLSFDSWSGVDLKKYIDNLQKISSSSKNENLKNLYRYEREIYKSINKRDKIEENINSIDLESSIKKLYNKVDEIKGVFLIIGKFTKLTLISVIMFLVPFILYLHRRGIKDKNELIAYKFAIEKSDNSMIITDLNSNIVYVNEAFERESGYTKMEVLGQNPSILQSGLMQNDHYKNIYRDLKERGKWEGEFVNRRKDGTIYYEKASIVPIVIDGKITNYLAIKLNITDYIEQEKRVEFIAYHDTLTSLPNRLHFKKYFKEEVENRGLKIALLYMDLDRFKNINDSLGHHVGDALLKIFADRLREILGNDRFIARLGGDEFISIIKMENDTDVEGIAQCIIDSFKTPIEIEGHNINITTSVGIAFYPDDANSLEDLMMFADTAMYEAKRSGKDRFKLFTKELSLEISKKLEMEDALRGAIENGEIYLMYQPKYSLESNKIVGFEALVRWESEKLGFVPPDRFIPLAEELGFIREIGYFIFEQACIDLKKFKQLDPTIRNMAINISPLQLKEEGFIEKINGICKELRISQTSIELEVTENYLMEDIESNIELLYELREHGFRVAIDDFGTGYSSFAYLKSLPVNTLKIDKVFVDDICIAKKDRDIVKTIVDLAKTLGFHIVAEGIEHKDQESLLRELGVSMGQGYHFSKPLKLEDAKEFINSKREVLV
jgi:diguanylate cyclase (GGDEF)-like protein/PAS domain S-box-containing protein